MFRRASWLFGILTLAVAATASERTRPDIVMIVADDLRPDALAVTGNPEVRTPHLDRLAARGARFTRATCSYPICHVSRTEMFAGRPLVAAAGKNGANALPFDPAWTLYPAHFAALGWRTIHSGKWHVAGSPRAAGFAETAGLFSPRGGPAGVAATLPETPTGRAATGYVGWTFKDNDNKPLPQHGVGLTPHTDRIMTDFAVAAAARAGDGPLFLQVNFTAPHDPLHWPAGREGARDFRSMALPGNFRAAHPFETGNLAGRDERIVAPPRTPEAVRRERAIYFTQVEHIDAQVGRIVAAVERAGRLERTIFVFTSDHGLALGSHGLMGKQNQYEHTINVPLILAGPGVTRGVFPAQCYLRDLYPTLCELAGIAIPGSVAARSLRPVLRGERTEIHDEIFGYFTGTQRMVREAAGWKLIHYPVSDRFQLFHVFDDPLELRNLIADPAHAAHAARLREKLAAWQRAHGDPALTGDGAGSRP
ncbi:MAG: sulfatase-like hydrolase/transferase [Opitutaceae bacterium]|nr:sulfatase-like hydrolase/transferase [Opitutaceae bacterium]